MFWNKRKEQKRMTVSDMNNYTWSTEFGANMLTDPQFKESTYFKCIKRLSEDIAKCPVQLKQHTPNGDILAKDHYLYNLVGTRPNYAMSNFDFFKCMEATRQHKGASWALIARDAQYKVTGLYPITVTGVIIDNVGLAKTTMSNPILIQYTCGYDLKQYYCFYTDVIHFKSVTLDGLTSICIKDTLQDTIDTNASAQTYQKDLFANGLTSKVAVQMTSDISDKKQLQVIQDKFNKIYSSAGRIFTVPAGYKVEPLNISLADSQFSELKKLNAIDICSTFGIPGHLIGIMDGYNNNSLEQSNLNYLVNTLLILFETNEAELNYKLLTAKEIAQGYFFSANTNVLLRTDKKTQADILTQYIASSVYTPNEARLELGKDKNPDGDFLIASSGTLKLRDLYNIAATNAKNSNDNNIDNSTDDVIDDKTINNDG